MATRKESNDNAITRDSLYGTTPEPTYSGILSCAFRYGDD
jgi:hypothetical protein